MPVITDSRHLAEADWDEGVLTIRFHSGHRGRYKDVPVGTYLELLGAESKSRFFRAHIKSVFEYEKIDD
jgi:hypothetical protein